VSAAATALLFDRDEVEEIEDWTGTVGSVGRRAILWIDVEKPDDEAIRELAEGLDLHDETCERLGRGSEEPYFGDFGEYLHVTAYAPCKTRGESRTLEEVGCLVSDRWVVTVHEGEVPVLDSFRERAEGSGETGRLEGLEFVAALLGWVVEGYLEAFEDIEKALEDIDERSMRGHHQKPEETLEALIRHRREVGRLRRALVAHRPTLLSLSEPELGRISSTESAERFTALRGRLEDAVQGARDSRDSVVGSFDVLIARTGYRTNEIMKVLTLASVLLLPGALVAGILGMNFEVGLFDYSWLFWVVVGAILTLAAATIAVGRARDWI
jgi:magnesium transporter